MKRRTLVPNDDLITIRDEAREFIQNDQGWWSQAAELAQDMGLSGGELAMSIAATAIQLWEVNERGFDVDEAKSRKELMP